MDFSVIDLDEDTAAFAAEVSAWLDTSVTDEMVEAEWTSGDGHDVDFHRALGARGWAFPTLPTAEGGAGLDPLRTRILATELARRQVPSTIRNITALVMPAVRQWMVGPQRDEILRRAAAGEIAFCLGYTEPEAGSDLAAVRTRAVQDGDEWVINGQKMFTTGAHLCDYCFLLARTDPDVPEAQGPDDVPRAARRPRSRDPGRADPGRRTDQHGLLRRGPGERRLPARPSGPGLGRGPRPPQRRAPHVGGRPPARRGGARRGRRRNGGPTSAPTSSVCTSRPSGPRCSGPRTPGPDGRRPIDDPRVRDRLADIELGVVVVQADPRAPGPGPVGRHDDPQQRRTASTSSAPPRSSPAATPPTVGDGWIEYAHRFAQARAIYGGTTEVIRNLIAERFLGLGRGRR